MVARETAIFAKSNDVGGKRFQRTFYQDPIDTHPFLFYILETVEGADQLAP